MIYFTREKWILASASPRRRQLLGSVGLTFDVIPAQAEPLPNPGETPEQYALRAAGAKAMEVAQSHPDCLVLGADTVVALDNELMGKPGSPEEALAMLQRLCGPAGGQGRTHRVVTGCCFINPAPQPGDGEAEVRELTVSTEVRMAVNDPAALAAYAASPEPRDKAGAYAIQGTGGFLVREIRGSYSNVVGLPLAEVLEVLVSYGVILPQDTQSFPAGEIVQGKC